MCGPPRPDTPHPEHHPGSPTHRYYTHRYYTHRYYTHRYYSPHRTTSANDSSFARRYTTNGDESRPPTPATLRSQTSRFHEHLDDIHDDEMHHLVQDRDNECLCEDCLVRQENAAKEAACGKGKGKSTSRDEEETRGRARTRQAEANRRAARQREERLREEEKVEMETKGRKRQVEVNRRAAIYDDHDHDCNDNGCGGGSNWKEGLYAQVADLAATHIPQAQEGGGGEEPALSSRAASTTLNEEAEVVSMSVYSPSANFEDVDYEKTGKCQTSSSRSPRSRNLAKKIGKSITRTVARGAEACKRIWRSRILPRFKGRRANPDGVRIGKGNFPLVDFSPRRSRGSSRDHDMAEVQPIGEEIEYARSDQLHPQQGVSQDQATGLFEQPHGPGRGRRNAIVSLAEAEGQGEPPDGEAMCLCSIQAVVGSPDDLPRWPEESTRCAGIDRDEPAVRRRKRDKWFGLSRKR